MWYERYNFVANPYTIVNPFRLPDNLFVWNRDDLKDRWQFESFVQGIKEGRRLALTVYGDVGSGKTWLLRMIGLALKGENILTIYIPIEETSPTFDAIYDEFIKGIMPYIGQIREGIAKRIGFEESTIEKWSAIVPDRNLASCLWHIHHEPEARYDCEAWLEGEKLSIKTRTDLKLTTNLDQAFKKFDIMRSLIEVSQLTFLRVVLMVDELGFIHPPSNRRAFSGVLRNLLDSFSNHFGLVCSFTGRAADDLLDLGYGPWLTSRFDYSVYLSPLEIGHLPNWLAMHNKVYRKPGVDIKDQLFPFTEDGIKVMVQMMRGDMRFPRYILENCSRLADITAGKLIDKDFVIENKSRLRELTTQPTLI